MKLSENGKLLRVFIGEMDQYEGKPLYEAILNLAREQGLAGCTIVRGLEGFGASSRVHTAKILRLSEDLPILIEIVDEEKKIDTFLPHLDKMIQDGLVTLESVKVLLYRSQKKS